MIQVYEPNNTNFDMNGDEVLTPSCCEAVAELGGTWILEMTHPIDDEGKWKGLVKEAVIAVPTFMGKKQLYRIDETDKQDTEISVKAYPVFFDSADEVFLMDTRPTGKNGQQALDILMAGTKYSGESNITAVNTAYFVRRNLMNAINGDTPSFIEVWGGEPLYDNFKVIINEHAGGDYGAEVRYGKNMDGISIKEDMSEVVTRIVPVAFNGRMLSSSYVDSPLVNNYAKVYTRELVFEDVKYFEDVMNSEDTSKITVCNSQEELDAALIAKCKEQFEAGIDLYKVTMDIDVISLENTEEYKDFQDIVKIGLGDTVNCHNKRLGISTQARAIRITWDCITDSIKGVVLGDYEYNVFDLWNNSAQKIENIVNKDGSVMAEKVQGIIDGIKAQLKIQSTVAQKQDARAILFEDLDPNSPLYGAMALGTQGLQISNKRTADGRDWEWSTAFTAKGGYADAIIIGILSDKTGKTSWNLDTGEFILSPETKIEWGQVTDANKYATQVTKNTVTTEYIKTIGVEADSIKTGVLSDKTEKNKWNLDSGKLEMTEGVIKIIASVVKKAVDYSKSDLERVNSITLRNILPTIEDLEKYDLNGDGAITIADVVLLNKLVSGEISEYVINTELVIDPLTTQSILKTLGVSIGTNGLYSQNANIEKLLLGNISVAKDGSGYANGVSGTFTTLDGKTVTIINGIVVSIV